MVATRPQIERIAREFWATSYAEFRYNYDIIKVVESSPNVHLIRIPQLNPTKITSWLTSRKIDIPVENNDRSLDGALLIQNGTVIMFIDTAENDIRQRYTLAHQVSHFLLAYQMPKERAIIKLGKEIAAALKDDTEAPVTQLVQSALQGMTGAAYTLLIEKSEDAFPSDRLNLLPESPADTLALELLAPRYQIIQETASASARLRYSPFKRTCQELLIDKYRIPLEIAHKYAKELASSVTSGPSFLSKFGF